MSAWPVEPPVALAQPPATPEGDLAESPLQALRLSAVHVSGIESLRNGESDLELRFSDAGLDLLKASSGAAIGRLLWSEIHSVDVASARRGLRPGRRVQELHVRGPERPGHLPAARHDLSSRSTSISDRSSTRLRGDRDRS